MSSKDSSEESLHENTTLFRAKDQEFSIDEILKISKSKFKPLPNANTDLGFTDEHYWLHFKVQNKTINNVTFYIETSRPIVDEADFYQISGKMVVNVQKSGDDIPFDERTFKNRKTIFKLFLLPNEVGEYYIHLKSDGEVINAPVMLRSQSNLLEMISFEQIVFGFFYGMLVISALLYFFFYFAMKEKVFLYYTLYVVFIGLLQFALDGYFYQFVAPDAGFLSNKAVLLFAIISGYFLGSYAQNYLKVKEINKKLNAAFYGLYFMLGALLFVVLFVPSLFKFGYPAMNFLGLILLILIISSLVDIYIKTKVVYQFFSLGIISLVAGFVIFILKNFGVFQYSFITENSSKLGTGFEIIFLSLSMANLIKKLKDERVELQALALQKSEEMNEMKSYFLSNISHELRTPLNTILNFIDAINGETDSNSIQEKCKVIKNSSKSLLSSVNDIFDFSKIEKNEIKLEPAIFDAHQLFDEIKNNVSIRAKRKEIDFQFTQSLNVPKMVYGDENRIRQIIMNLLSNALKFTNDGNVKFKVDASPINDATIALKFIVSDTGVGISKDKMSSVFESFSQQTINNKRQFGGLGLGLFIVKALVDLHKGTIEMDSVENQGTVCVVKLNVTRVETKEVKVTEQMAGYDLKGKRILVVEDNAMNQMVLKMIFKKWENTEVDFANNGEEGLQSLKKQKYDIILMDLQMPVMDGYEATIAIRSGESGINNKDIPIVAVTADVMEATKDRVKEIGMNYYLSKPVDKDTLFSIVKNYVS